MKSYFSEIILLAFLSAFNSSTMLGQCANNLGFENGNYGSWSTSTDSNFITPLSRRYYKPGLTQAVVNYGSSDAWLGTISKPSSLCGNNLTRIGNKGLLATADTVYRKYVIDSLSDKLTIYSRGVVEIAHNYWGLSTIEAPGFGYEVYLNGKKLDCLKGSFFCGNQDLPYVWNIGNYKDTAGIRKSVGWAKEDVNLACYVGDTIEIRLFTRDCILLGHYAYAYFDVVCGDTTKPTITRIMVNDIIDSDKLDLFCTDSTALTLAPNTSVCPIFRSNVKWSPASYVSGSDSTDNVILHNLDSVWIFAEALFTNHCTSLNVRDSILIIVHSFDPHDNIHSKLPQNFCDCKEDTIDFGTSTITSVKDQNGNTMTLNNGKLIILPCDKFYVETFWKNESAKIHLNNSQIGTSGWSTGNVEGAIGYDSILATGTVRYIVEQNTTKKFFAGITTNNINNSNDMDFAIYFNGGAISAYYRGSLKAGLGTYTGTVTIEFKTLINRRVELWINGAKAHTYTNAQKAVFPIFPDFAGQCNDTAIINKTYIYGPTKNIKDFTRLLVPTTFLYFISYADRCGINVKDTIKIIPGYASVISPKNIVLCGLTEAKMITSSGSFIVDEIIATSNGDGIIRITDSMVFYAPVPSDYLISPVSVFISTRSGRCSNTDTGYATFNEVPVADAGPDILIPVGNFSLGGAPTGSCSSCPTLAYSWSPSIALDDSTNPYPTVTKSMISSNSFSLRVVCPASGCLSNDSLNLYTILPIKNISIESECIGNNQILFKWALTPSTELYSFSIEYSTDNGLSWISSERISTDPDNNKNGNQTYTLTMTKNRSDAIIYRWCAFNVNGDKKTIMPIDAFDCRTNTSYTIFPIPFSDELSINITNENPKRSSLTLTLFNEYGQKVLEESVKTSETNHTNIFILHGTVILPDGIYLLTIYNNYNILYTSKIIKHQ